MLKRLLGLALILALAVALMPISSGAKAQDDSAVNCGTDEEVTLTWIAGTVGSEHDATVHQAERFMEVCPNITVEVVDRPTSSTETLAQYQQFFEAQSNEIDVYQIDVIWPAMLAEHLVDLSEYVDQSFIDEFFPAIIANNTIDGRLVGLPWFAGAGMLYYRTDLLEKYGLEVPTTWDALAEAARTIQEGERGEGNPDFWGFVFQGAAYEGLTCDALEWQASVGGGTILTPEGVIQVNNPETIAMFDKVASWIGDFVPEGALNFQEEDARAVWHAGNAAFMRNWGYAYPLSEAEDSAVAGNFGVTTLPGGEEGMSAATLGGWQLAVSKYSDNIPAAAALVAFVTDYEGQVIYTLERGEQPTMPAAYEDERIAEQLPYIAEFQAVLGVATARPGVAGANYAQVSELYYTAVHSVLAGEADATTAMEELELDLADMGFEFPE
jgi:trehalose/maltose transport system substrate-binding protein